MWGNQSCAMDPVWLSSVAAYGAGALATFLFDKSTAPSGPPTAASRLKRLALCAAACAVFLAQQAIPSVVVDGNDPELRRIAQCTGGVYGLVFLAIVAKRLTPSLALPAILTAAPLLTIPYFVPAEERGWRLGLTFTTSVDAIAACVNIGACPDSHCTYAACIVPDCSIFAN